MAKQKMKLYCEHKKSPFHSSNNSFKNQLDILLTSKRFNKQKEKK